MRAGGEGGRREVWNPPPTHLFFTLFLFLVVFAGGIGYFALGLNFPLSGESALPVPNGETTEEDLRRTLEEFLRWGNTPGLSACVVRDGQPILVAGFGVVEVGSDLPVTRHTLFHLASVSKTFVAAAVLRLAEEGRIELDQPLAGLLSSFRPEDVRGARITVRHLLTHTSGLPDVRGYGWDDPEWDAGALQRYALSLNILPLHSDPGAAFAYSNLGYDLLGAMIEEVTGESFEDSMEGRVLDPLGMANSTFRFPVRRKAALASPHTGRFGRTRIGSVYPYNRIHAPSSTLHSSAEEMCRWLVANLEAGRGPGPRILTEQSHEVMWSTQVEVRRNLDFGLGWMMTPSASGLQISHGGRDPGFSSQLSLYPDVGGGIALLSNHDGAPLGRLRDILASLAFP